MICYLICYLICLIIVILITNYFLNKYTYEIENFWDITPYNQHWKIFSCLDQNCVRKKSYECFKWCDNWAEPGGRENCRMRCMDYADEMFDQLKFMDYRFHKLLPKFNNYSLLTNNDYF